MSRRHASRAYFLASLTVIATMAALPATGWLVRQQLRVLCAGAPFPGIEEPHSGAATHLRAAEESVAAAHPGNFDLQLAVSLRRVEAAEGDYGSDGSDGNAGTDGLQSASVRALLALRVRFGNRPELDAAILRFLSRGDLCLNRSEESILYPPRPAKQPAEGPQAYGYQPSTKMSSPAAIRLAEDTAVRGEASDPTNAFFPTLLAAAMLAEHRDKEALIALHHAADLPLWNDYASGEARARTTLLIAANRDEPGCFSRVVTAQNVTLAHLLVLRRLAYAGTALAVQREIAGNREGGFAIRRSISHVGAKLLEAAEYWICASRGADMISVAAGRPGGSPALEKRFDQKDRYNAEIEAGYVAYLTRTGHPDEAAWFTGERSRSDRILSILKIADDRSNMGLADVYSLAYWWDAGLIAITDAIAVVLFGGLCALFARTPRISSGLPMHPAVRYGLVVAFLVPICAFATPILFRDSSSAGVPNEIATFGIGVVALALFRLKRRQSWRGFARNFAVFAATIGSTLGILATFAWLGSGLMTPLAALMNFCYARSFGLSWPDIANESMFVGVLLTVPAALTLMLGVRSRLKRVPVSVGVVRDMPGIALPAAATLLLVFACLCAGTLVQETTTRRHIDDRQQLGEGRAAAQVIGVDWPKPEPAPTGKR